MLVVKIELWPHGDQSKAKQIGELRIANDGTGTSLSGNYNGEASHSGKYFGRRRGVYKKGKVRAFNRRLSPYRLVCRMLQSMGEI